MLAYWSGLLWKETRGKDYTDLKREGTRLRADCPRSVSRGGWLAVELARAQPCFAVEILATDLPGSCLVVVVYARTGRFADCPGGFSFSFGTKVPRLCFASVAVHTTTSGPRAAEEEETSVVSSPLASSHGVRLSRKKNLIVCLSCCSASRWATGRRASLRCARARPPAPTVGQHRHRSVDLVASFPPTFVAVVFQLRVLAPSGFSRTGR